MTTATTEMRQPTRSAKRRLVLVTEAVAAADWLSKLVGSSALDERVIELPGIDLRLTRNPGVAFGIAAGAPSWLVLGVTTVVVCILAVAAWRGSVGTPIPAGLILGGAIANVVDRGLDGTVVDLLDLGWWPSFNVADAAITLGAVLLALHLLHMQPARSDEPAR